MAKKNAEQKESFWQRYKFYIFGLLGAVLLLSFFGVQSVVISYQTDEGEAYTAKMEYSVFNMCINCMPLTDNSADLVEKALFTFSGKNETVERAAEGLQEIAGTEKGSFLIRVSGVMGSSEKNTAKLIAHLESLGYQAAPME